tara:strand:+ start:3093 stop:3335 length:243 start_codon:yes stop_codon:yes gene_type:complete
MTLESDGGERSSAEGVTAADCSIKRRVAVLPSRLERKVLLARQRAAILAGHLSAVRHSLNDKEPQWNSPSGWHMSASSPP